MAKRMIKRLVRRIADTRYVRSALSEQADLSLFKQKPTPRVIWGLIIVGISYTIGWPLITLLGFVAACTGRPLILAVGGPVAYGLSHLVFILGAYVAGAQYAHAFLRWSTRILMKKLLVPQAPHQDKKQIPGN